MARQRAVVPDRDVARHEANAALARRRDAGLEAAQMLPGHSGNTARALRSTQLDGELAIDALVKENHGLAVMWARRYHPTLRHVPLQELIDVAVNALGAAAQSWKHEAGSSFAAWASFGIRSQLQRRVTRFYGQRLAPKALAIKRATLELERELLRKPTPQELATKVGLSVERVTELSEEIRALHLLATVQHLDAPTMSGMNLHDRIGAHRATSLSVSTMNLSGLAPRHKRLVKFIAKHRASFELPEIMSMYATHTGASVEEVAGELRCVVASLSDGGIDA